MEELIGKHMGNNVITFPKKNKQIPDDYTFESIDKNVEMMKHYHIQETIANLAPMIFNQLDIAGFMVVDEEEDESDLKDGAFIIEALRSMMCKHFGIFHPLQVVSENIFVQDDEDPNAMRIVDELNVNLKRPDPETE